MQTHLVVLVSVFPILVAQSQTSSTRLSGMGNISIAVVDTESEAFSNPAKASWIGTGLVRLNPYYFGTSNDYSQSTTSGTSGYTPSSMSSSGRNAQYGIPIGVIIPVSNFRIGAAASVERMTYHQDGKDWSGGTYPTSTNSSQDTKSPYTSLNLLASVDLGWGSVGAIGSWSGSTTEAVSNSNYPLQTPPTYSESAYQDDESNHAYGLGAFFGSTQTAQASVTVATEGYHDETKPTRSVYNGTTADLSQPDIALASRTSTRLVGELRKSYPGNILAGVRISYWNATVDQSEKYTWSDPGVIYPVYDERKTSTSDVHEYRFGLGVSKTIEGTGLFSIEFVYAPYNSHQEAFQTTSGIYPDGRMYNRGDVSSTSDNKTGGKEVRIGAELEITSELIARVGLEVAWQTYEGSSRSTYYATTNDVSGETDASYYGAGGFSYYVGSMRIDYSFGMTPYYWYTPYYYGPSRDVILQHTASLSFQF